MSVTQFTDEVASQVNRPHRVGTSLPTTCKRGEIFILVGTTNKLYVSFSTNTWTEVSSVNAGGAVVDAETPAGTLDGVNNVFTLAHAPSPVTSLRVYVGGMRKIVTTEYTLSSVTLTLDVSAVPGISDSFVVSYRY